MKKIKILCLLTALLFCSFSHLEARIKLVEFTNHSDLVFNDSFADGRPYRCTLDSNQSILIDQEGAEIATIDGELKIILEDAHRSGYHRPHWKYHVWIETKDTPFFACNRILYAVVFYDGDGEVKLIIDEDKKLHVRGGYDVKDILYPWKIGTIGRGNPYHKIKGVQVYGGIKYFDYDGFVGYPYNSFSD